MSTTVPNQAPTGAGSVSGAPNLLDGFTAELTAALTEFLAPYRDAD